MSQISLLVATQSVIVLTVFKAADNLLISKFSALTLRSHPRPTRMWTPGGQGFLPFCSLLCPQHLVPQNILEYAHGAWEAQSAGHGLLLLPQAGPVRVPGPDPAGCTAGLLGGPCQEGYLWPEECF